LVPEEFKRFGTHLLNGGAFTSNFRYWHEAGYFDTTADTKPLLHLWSLAVEEQFYLAWPFLLWLARKVGLNLFLAALFLAIPSFITNVVNLQHQQLDAAFYSPEARFWELMLGAMFAYLQTSSFTGSSTFRNFQSFTGVMAICLAFGLITRDAQFPGWWALLPTVGTALMISAGPFAWLNRAVLSHSSFVNIGLISYPLYLWHWPLLSFARIVEGETPTAAVRLGLVALSVALAFITYRTVERPIRDMRRNNFRSCAALSALLLAMIFVGFGAQKGYSPSSATIATVNQGEIVSEDGNDLFFGYQHSRFYPCTPEDIRNYALKYNSWTRSLQSNPSERKDIAVIGDSHAEDLFIGLAESLKTINVVAYIQGLLPIRSTKVFDKIFDYVERDANIHAVVLAAYWRGREHEVRNGNSLESELVQIVAELTRAGKSVYLTDNRPDFPFDPSVCKFARRLLFWQLHPLRCEMERALFYTQRSRYHTMLTSIAAKHPNVHLLDAVDFFCDEQFCHMAKGHKLLFRDRHHLTIAGSQAVAGELTDQLLTAQKSASAILH
jgi:hypothetical protein